MVLVAVSPAAAARASNTSSKRTTSCAGFSFCDFVSGCWVQGANARPSARRRRGRSYIEYSALSTLGTARRQQWTACFSSLFFRAALGLSFLKTQFKPAVSKRRPVAHATGPCRCVQGVEQVVRTHSCLVAFNFACQNCRALVYFDTSYASEAPWHKRLKRHGCSRAIPRVPEGECLLLLTTALNLFLRLRERRAHLMIRSPPCAVLPVRPHPRRTSWPCARLTRNFLLSLTYTFSSRAGATTLCAPRSPPPRLT